MDSAQNQLAEKIKNTNNVLITVSRDPSVDQLSAMLGLALAINKTGSHAAAVFSGTIPSTIEFLKPEDTFQKNTDSLRDFIIALDKSKADKLRYKVEDDLVRIFITPYKTSLSDADFAYSQGDFNVDLVVALGVERQEDLDEAITAHGRILHDATVSSITTTSGEGDQLGSINWHEEHASSLSELVTELIQLLDPNLVDGQIATALLTGIVSSTERFSNDRTSSQTMSASALLMAAGANQQLVASKLEAPVEAEQPVEEPANEESPEDPQPAEEEQPENNDGTLEIDHHEPEPIPEIPTEDPAPEPEAEPAPAPEPEPTPAPAPEPEPEQIPLVAPEPVPQEQPAVEAAPPQIELPEGIEAPATPEPTIPEAPAFDPTPEPLPVPAPDPLPEPEQGTISGGTPVLTDQPIQEEPQISANSAPEPRTDPFDALTSEEPQAAASNEHRRITITPPAQHEMRIPTPDELGIPGAPVFTPPAMDPEPAPPVAPTLETFSALSPTPDTSVAPTMPTPDVGDARDEVQQALNADTTDQPLPPITALNAQPLGQELHPPETSAPSNDIASIKPAQSGYTSVEDLLSNGPEPQVVDPNAPPPVPPPFNFGGPGPQQ